MAPQFVVLFRDEVDVCIQVVHVNFKGRKLVAHDVNRDRYQVGEEEHDFEERPVEIAPEGVYLVDLSFLFLTQISFLLAEELLDLIAMNSALLHKIEVDLNGEEHQVKVEEDDGHHEASQSGARFETLKAQSRLDKNGQTMRDHTDLENLVAIVARFRSLF